MELQLHLFLTLELIKSEWLLHAPAALLPVKRLAVVSASWFEGNEISPSEK
jgi:hypothetical protein